MFNHSTTLSSARPDAVGLPDKAHAGGQDVQSLQVRVRELETLCAGVYVAAVELGLPQPLLNGLWTVAGCGNAPSSFAVDLPPRPDTPAGLAIPAAVAEGAESLPDVRLIDRPPTCDVPRGAPRPELKPLATRRTVLVVDDDPMMLEVLVRILQRENYEIVQASSGPEALAKAAVWSVDLLVTDYSMPDMHGRELADKIRQRRGSIPVLYQTGFSDMLFDDRGELEEHAAFLEKPFTARGLCEAVRFRLFGELNPSR